LALTSLAVIPECDTGYS